MFDNVKIVLVATTHPGNIGAAARAMKAMGFSRLCLVQPKIFPHVEATARAAGADDLLANAVVVASLEEAISDCHLIIGTSARTRDLPLALLDPRQAAEKIVDTTLQYKNSERGHGIAIVFGRESSGLSNEELQLCNYHLFIPTNPEFSSLNVASAVQIVVYEITQAYRYVAKDELVMVSELEKKEQHDVLATSAEMQLFYQHLEKVLVELEFLDPKNPRKLMPRLYRLFNRIHLEHLEVNLLRGILTAVQEKCSSKDK